MSAATAQNRQVNIASAGAKADGLTVNTWLIQRLIDSLHAAGGGSLVVPAGKFVTGSIYLKSNTGLHLQSGAVLLGSTSRLDYGSGDATPLISAIDQQNIHINGPGTIDGQGAVLVKDVYRLLEAGHLQDAQWKTKRPEERNRPRLILMKGCSNIQVTGITIQNGSGWVQDYMNCTDIMIDSITVNSTTYWNNDGIDIVNSKHVSITNCDVNAADDAICLKSEGGPGFCEDVYVANCRLRSSASAFKLGTGSSGGFRNIKVRNLTVYDTYRSAIALEAVDGGFLEHVDIAGVKAVNTGNAIFIRLGHRNKNSNFSIVKNIHIKDVYVEVPATKPDKGYNTAGPLLRYPPGVEPPAPGQLQSISPWNHTTNDSTAILFRHNPFPASIAGLPGHPVQHIILENIEIVYPGGAGKNTAYFPPDSLHRITEAEAVYPEFSMFGELPAWGLYIRHATGIALKNVTLRYKKADFRVPIIADDVNGLHIERLHIPQAAAGPVILLNNVQHEKFTDLKIPENMKVPVKRINHIY